MEIPSSVGGETSQDEYKPSSGPADDVRAQHEDLKRTEEEHADDIPPTRELKKSKASYTGFVKRIADVLAIPEYLNHERECMISISELVYGERTRMLLAGGRRTKQETSDETKNDKNLRSSDCSPEIQE